MGIGAAIAGGAALSATAGVASGVLGSSAATSAANTQAAASDQATQAALQEFQQTEANEQPYMTAGSTALSALQSTLGLGGSGPNLLPSGLTFSPVGGSTFQPTQAQLEETPGYQFDLSQGLQSTQNANSAQGLGVSGAALKGAANYATGLANNTLSTQDQIFQSNLGNQQSIFQQNYGDVINPLQSLSNLGQNAATQTGNQGVQATQNANAALIGGANAQAAGTVGSANAISSGLTGIGNSASNYALLNSLMSSNGSSGGGWDNNVASI